MLAIKKALLEYILNNQDLRNLLNADIDDDRVYSWNPPQDIVYSDNKNSAVFYRLFVNQRPGRRSYPQQFANMFLYLRIVSRSELSCELISEKIISILDEKYNFMLDENWSVKKINMTNYNDGSIEGTPTFPLYVKNISFSLAHVFQR